MKQPERASLLGKRRKLQGYDMRIEALISTMNEKSIDCYKRFNLETDCLIINQAGYNNYEELDTGRFKVRMITTDTIGVGISRNLALLNSTADIQIFCDDDEVFNLGYKKAIEEEFDEHPDVDFFIFKTIIYQEGKEIIKVKEDKDLSLFNALRYGAVHFVFKRESIRSKNIFVSTSFGGGSGNGSGEDSLFIRDAFKNKLKLRASTKLLARVYNDKSTWFNGFDEKFFYDKGKLSKALFPLGYRLYIESFVRRHREMLEDVGINKARALMIKGARDFGGRNEN